MTGCRSPLERLRKAQSFVVILKPFPRGLGEGSFNERHINAFGDGLPPSRAGVGRADVSGIQCHREVFGQHPAMLPNRRTGDNTNA